MTSTSAIELASQAGPGAGTKLSDLACRAASNCAMFLHQVRGASPGEKFGILMYHRVARRPSGMPAPTINVTPQSLEGQIGGLAQRGHQFVSLRDVLDCRLAGKALPRRAVVITFDDGFAGVYRHALPILQRYSAPATVFLNTAYADSGQPFPFDAWGRQFAPRAGDDSHLPLTWSMCRELIESGLIDFGAHTHTHQDFRQRPAEFAQDLRLNLRSLRDRLGVERPTFAFPYGTPRLGFASPELTTEARHAGVCCALNTRHEILARDSDPFTWGRINVFDWDTPATLAAKLAGWYGWIPAQRRHARRLFSARPGDAESVAIPRSAPVLARASAERAFAVDSGQVDVSIVMPTYNRAHWVTGALDSLSRLETGDQFTFEVVVIDNRSSDDTRRVLANYAASSPLRIKYVHETRPGDAPTRNAGLREAQGQWFAFFDDDQFAEPRWLLELMRAARESGGQIVGGPVLLDLPEDELRRLGPVCRGVLREIRFYDQLQPYQGKDLPGAGNSLVHRSVMEAVGTFDESMSMGGSDSDFFLRARGAGFQLWYAPQAAIRHRISRSRVTPEFFRWESLSGGAGHAAHFDQQKFGLAGQVAMCGIRAGHAATVSLPRLAWAWCRGDEGGVLGQRAKLWRTEGYLRRTLSRLAPRWFAQREFFEWLDFRHGRALCSDQESATPNNALACDRSAK